MFAMLDAAKHDRYDGPIKEKRPDLQPAGKSDRRRAQGRGRTLPAYYTGQHKGAARWTVKNEWTNTTQKQGQSGMR